jgi:hypothetical protein
MVSGSSHEGMGPKGPPQRHRDLRTDHVAPNKGMIWRDMRGWPHERRTDAVVGPIKEFGGEQRRSRSRS